MYRLSLAAAVIEDGLLQGTSGTKSVQGENG
jgi:hypothetical protein